MPCCSIDYCLRFINIQRVPIFVEDKNFLLEGVKKQDLAFRRMLVLKQVAPLRAARQAYANLLFRKANLPKSPSKTGHEV